MVQQTAARHHMQTAAMGRVARLALGRTMAKLDALYVAALGSMLVVLMPGCGVSPGARWMQQVKENESPKQGIDFTWTVHDAPGSFGKVVARAQYEVLNSGECGYVQPATGTAMGMTTSREVPLERVSDVAFKGRVLEDLFLDGNYYGRAQCRWVLTRLNVAFLATGAESDTGFWMSMERAPLASGATQTDFFPGKLYPGTDGYSGNVAYGRSDVNDIPTKFREGAFSASMERTGARQ